MNCNCTDCPCWCIGTHTLPPTEKPCKKGECIKLGYILVKPEDSVGPCNKQGKVSLKCYDFSACCKGEDGFKIEVVHNSSPDKLIVNSITKDELVFTTTSEANAYDKIVLTVKAECCKLGDYGQITIFIKDLCDCVKCTNGEFCNKCTAECEEVEGDLVLSAEGDLVTQNESGLILG